MSNFWATSDGDTATSTGNNYETGGGDLELIPDNSNVLAMIDSIGWDQDDNFNRFISARWTVNEPEQYRNRKIFHKLWVDSPDPRAKDPAKADQKRDKAKRMLAAIDANCGGKLAKKAAEPTDDDLALALSNRPMIIKVKTWSLKGDDGETKTGNWIAGVAPRTSGVAVAAAKASAAKSKADDLDDSQIPF